jgi:hypothetical protein
MPQNLKMELSLFLLSNCTTPFHTLLLYPNSYFISRAVKLGGAALRYWLYCCVYKLPLMVAGYPSNMVETQIIGRPFQTTIQDLIINITITKNIQKVRKKEIHNQCTIRAKNLNNDLYSYYLSPTAATKNNLTSLILQAPLGVRQVSLKNQQHKYPK